MDRCKNRSKFDEFFFRSAAKPLLTAEHRDTIAQVPQYGACLHRAGRYSVNVDEERIKTPRAGVGLCADCRFMRLIESARGSTFYLCERSAADARFPKYPRLPVLRCAGYELLSADRDRE